MLWNSEKSCRYKIFHSGCFASKRRRHLRIPSEYIVDFRALIHKALKCDFSSRCRSGERHVVKTAERKCMRILDELKGCGSIGISGHENPDGDCAGSCMGMALFLRKAMPQARVDVFLEPLRDELYNNIPGTDTIITDFNTDVEHYDAFIVLDSAKDRISRAEALFDLAEKTINIDHHISNSGTGMVNYVNGSSSSACELVYEVIDHDLIDEKIAQAIYVGMVTDTGCFRFSNTSRRTMEIAGELMTYGFDFPRIVREVYFEKTYVQQRVLGKALTKAKSYLGGRLIVSRLDHLAIQALGGVGKDVEGIVSALVSTTGADCSIFAHERSTGEWRVSFRSNKVVDVASIARHYGGGGHIRASGCTIKKDRDISCVILEMVKMVEEQLEAAKDQ